MEDVDVAQTWTDAEVNFGERPAPNANWDGFLKSDGTPVRRCDGGHWKLLEEFPPKSVHFATWDCYFCHGIPKPPPKKSKKSEKSNRYADYVAEMRRMQNALIENREEFQRRRKELLEEKGRIDLEYRRSLR